jgi:hypothetical protein
MQAEGKLVTSAPALTRTMKGLNPMTQADSVHSTPPIRTPAEQASCCLLSTVDKLAVHA